MESVVGRPAQQPSSHMLERRAARPQKEAALNCPRCNSTNTKFCYYNNYSLSQPRYFCKTCRRYWTEGGSLRNVPVGGGSRKNKRSSSSAPSPSSHPTASSSSPNTTLLSPNTNINNTLLPQGFSSDQHHQLINPAKLMIHAAGQDLNLAYPPPPPPAPTSANSHYSNHPASSHMSAMELLKMNSFPDQMSSVSGSGGGGGIYASPMGFGLHGGSGGDYKPGSALNFSLDGFGSGGGGGYVNGEGVQESGACRVLFPFEDLKTHHGSVSSAADHQQQHQHQQHNQMRLEQQQRSRGDGHHGNNANSSATGYWNGMIGNGGSW